MIKAFMHIYPRRLWSLANNNGNSNDNGNNIVEKNGANVVVRSTHTPISHLLALMSPYMYHAPMCSIISCILMDNDHSNALEDINYWNTTMHNNNWNMSFPTNEYNALICFSVEFSNILFNSFAICKWNFFPFYKILVIQKFKGLL